MYRKIHRFIAIPLCAFMFLLGITGLLLTWKSELQLQPKTQKSDSSTSTLLPLETIVSIAETHITNKGLSTTIDRLDYRPSKGIAKIRFEGHFTELQVDCYSGKIISDKVRAHDIIEQIHDGSIVDSLFKNEYTYTKQLYSTLTALGLISLSVSGFWLWYKPKKIKFYKK